MPHFSIAEIDKQNDAVIKNNFNENLINVTASDLGLIAAKKTPLLFFNNVTGLIFTSEGSDYNGPQTSVWLHKQLFADNHSILCLDLPGGCTGFINLLMVAKSLIKSGVQKKIIGVLGEIVTQVIHPQDNYLKEIFSDAGASVVLSNCENENLARIGEFAFGTDSSGFESLIVRKSGTRERIDEEWLLKYKEIGGLPFGRMEMDERAIFMFIYKTVPILVQDILKVNEISFEEIDLFIFHQANGQILDLLKRKLKIPEEKFFKNFDTAKNSVSCSIPIALKQAMEQNKIKKGNKVLLAGFGIGFTWAGTVLYF